MIKRPKAQIGQLPFELPEIRDDSRPAMIIHKNSKYLLFRPQDVRAAVIYDQAIERVSASPEFRNSMFWGLRDEEGQAFIIQDWKKIEIWRHLEGNIANHPLARVLQAMGVELGVHPTLAGYVRREFRRTVLENTPYPVPASSGDASLFDRCSVGTVLRCIKDFYEPGFEQGTELENKIFTEGERYFVTSAGMDESDVVQIGTNALLDKSVMSEKEGATFAWSDMFGPMEEYFDDSEDQEIGPTVFDKYPERIAEAVSRLKKLEYNLFNHVSIDATAESLKRGTVNGKLMRMGKTSEGLTVAALWGSKKVAVFGSQNVLLAWEKECKRLGIKDYVFVDRLSDLDKPGRLYFMRYGWVRAQRDPSYKERKNKDNYLRKDSGSYKLESNGKKIDIPFSYLNHHPCPHCNVRMVRPILDRDFTGRVVKVEWTPQYGYMCRNKDCEWTSDNRKKKGAAWSAKGNKLVRHKGGTYVDWGLAAHANCTHENIKGRQCRDCGQVDSSWTPQISKRFKKKFTGIIPDEIHNIKDHTSLTYKAISRMRARHKMGMTGTFISNGAMDAFWIFLWIMRGSSATFPYNRKSGAKDFDARFCEHVTLEKPAGIDAETGKVIKKNISKRLPFLKNPTDWWKFIAPKFLRRNYSDPLYKQSLIDAGMFHPKTDIQKVVCPMNLDQTKLMLSAMNDFKEVWEKHKLEAVRNNREINKAFVIAQMSAMCTIATVPERINSKLGVEVYKGPSGGGKMSKIIALTKAKIANGGKVLILSDFIQMQIALERELTAEGIKVIRFNTSWNNDQRREAMELFAEDPDYTVVVAGTKAVSESVDFSAADTAICTDILWAPGFQQQAWSRILQATTRERVCEIFLFLSQNSIDEHKYDTFYSKLVGSEQSQDRKVVSRRARNFDIQWFVERVIADASALSLEVRGFDTGEEFVIPDSIESSMMEERFV